MIQGIDVSRYQKQVDWERVRASGITFCMVKASQGASVRTPMFTDRLFVSHLEGAERAGILCGAYHYLTATTPAEAAEEAAYFCAALAPYRDKLSLWAALDAEENHLRQVKTPGERCEILRAFLRVVEKNGFRPMLYTNPDFLLHVFGSEVYEVLSQMHAALWLAAWGADEKKIQKYGDVVIWQYSAQGQVPGIVGPVDLNAGFFLPQQKEPNEEIVSGDVVKVRCPLIYGTQKRFVLYYDTYDVLSVEGDRAVIGIRGEKRAVVTAAVDVKHLEKVRSNQRK